MDNNIPPATEPSPPAPQSPTVPEGSVRTWGMLCHLAGLAWVIGIPFGNILGPLIVWLIKKDEHPYVDEQGKKSLNFQISMAIYAAVAFLLVFVLVGIPILIALAVVDLVLIILASVKASNGQAFNYPLTIRFIK